MTAAPTAGALLRELDRRQYQSHQSALGDVADADREAVTRALKQVPRNAKVDVAVLIETLRKEAAARAEAAAARQPDVMAILRYRLSLASRGKLVELRDELRARVDAGEGDQPFAPGSAGASIMSRLDSIRSRITPADDVEPDDETGGDEPDKIDDDAKPRRCVPRIRSRRAAPLAADADTADGAPDQPPRQRTRPTRSPGRLAQQLSGRAFDAYGDITAREPDFPNPPWLLPDQPDESSANAA